MKLYFDGGRREKWGVSMIYLQNSEFQWLSDPFQSTKDFQYSTTFIVFHSLLEFLLHALSNFAFCFLPLFAHINRYTQFISIWNNVTAFTGNTNDPKHCEKNTFSSKFIHSERSTRAHAGKMNGKFGIIYRTFPTCVPAFRQFFYITIFSIRKVIFFTFHGKTQK